MRTTFVIVAVSLTTACHATDSTDGVIVGTQRVGEESRPLDAELTWTVTKDWITLETEGYPNGFDVRMHLWDTVVPGAQYDLAMMSPSIEMDFHIPAQDHTHIIATVLQGIVVVDQWPTSDQPEVTGRLEGLLRVQGDGATAIEFGLDASFQCRIDADAVTLLERP